MIRPSHVVVYTVRRARELTRKDREIAGSTSLGCLYKVASYAGDGRAGTLNAPILRDDPSIRLRSMAPPFRTLLHRRICQTALNIVHFMNTSMQSRHTRHVCAVNINFAIRTYPLSLTMLRDRESKVYCESVRTQSRFVTHSQYPVHADARLHGGFVSATVDS